MNISYDIFELADCPVIITDENFVITYKNSLASKLFCGFRRRSKITRYFRNFKNDVDFSDINELNIETGTQFMRALVLPIGENDLAFLFFTLYAFTDTKKLLEYVRENFAGSFIDFSCALYSAYNKSKKANGFARASMSERAYSELITLLSLFTESPLFENTEAHNISELLEAISVKATRTLSAFGLRTQSVSLPDECYYSKINLRAFCFIIFRMLYMAFRLSDTGKIQISLNSFKVSYADICVSTHTMLTDGHRISLIYEFPELLFEFDILKKAGVIDDCLSFSIENSILKLHYKIKCEANSGLSLRSASKEMQKKRISKAISEMLFITKSILSKK